METIKIVLNDIDYVTRNDKPIIRLFGINPETEENVIAVDTTFKPYLYVLPYDFDICLEDLREMGLDDLEVETKIDIGTESEFIKVILTHPQEVPKLRDSIRDLPSVKQIREYDIPFYRRYLIDKQITPTNIIELHGETIDSILYSEELKIDEDVTLFKMMENPIDTHKTNKRNKILSFDIEVYNAEGMPTAENDPIIMMSLCGNNGLKKVLSTKKSDKSFVETLSSEKDMLKRFVEIIKEENPDMLVGYNSDNFDLPYIKKRAEKLNIKLDLGVDGSGIKFMKRGFNNAGVIKGRVHVDLYLLVRRNMRLERYTLERVYEELFDEKKIDVPGDQIYQYWDSDDERLEELFDYSMDDAVTTTMIGDKLTPLTVAQTRLVGQPLFDIARMTTGQMVEWYLMLKAYEKNNIIPNKPDTDEYSQRRKSNKVIGGYVKEPEKGLFEHIAYLDFKSLYPSIIIAQNISPDTITDGENMDESEYYTCPENGYKFLKEPKGFIPSIIGYILDERQRIKKLMKEEKVPEQKRAYDFEQQGLKRLANSMFGAYGYSRFRWYKIECAAAITAWGREYIRNAMKKAEEYDFKPIYADTDGFYATYIGDLNEE
ncbi:DNA-directed DNA polymerase [Methanosphaera sp. Vir-13MRS]|uniref:DNA-directed DNA polymerase n=1 Tax=Candidatus Methanosphaera massiliense TaxID=3017187 RepID=UPI00237FFE27|nr:DNA-directed DNA polymerase [Candidatus Methanosphaera massiliense]MDD6285937.1 DNA-directed DNA polymerase [Methanobacteriaceae archaeon]MDE4077898.1 DNA-directed DNA polymerase [Candidatus Methanosphaera massiliense]